ncbi:MAG: carbohydrate-binding domain-containing protein [Prevotella sp.]
MRKMLTLLIALSAAWAKGDAQTLNIVTGNITYAIPAVQAGDMVYTDGLSLTVLGKVYALAEVDRMYIDQTDVTDNQIVVNYEGAEAKVLVAGNAARYLTISAEGADVNIVQSADLTEELTYVLQGASEDGSFFMDGELKATVVLNGLQLANADGYAIDIENGKRISVELADGTQNTLADGTGGTQKGCFMVNGHAEFKGAGTLTLTGNTKHAFWGDEYVQLKKSTGTITVLGAVGDGFNVNQYFEQNGGNVVISGVGDDGIQVSMAGDGETGDGQIMLNGGSLDITVSGDASKGLNAEQDITVTGGNHTITTTGNGTYDTTESEAKACAAIKTDANMTIDGGTLTLKSTGTGGKGIKTDGTLTINDGAVVNIVTTGAIYNYGSTSGGSTTGPGSNRPGGGGFPGGSTSSANTSSPKGIKSTGDLTINGGQVYVSSSASEGIESKSVLTINGGQVEVESSDDGINSASHMYIKGGDIYVNASSNDGLDSNGNLYIEGGRCVVYGSGSPECGLDANEEGGYKVYITGGTVVALGGSTSYPTSTTNAQPVIVYRGTASNGTTLALCDAQGTPVLAFKVGKAYSGTATVVITDPAMQSGSAYTLYSGATATGSDWHGLYTEATLSATGTSAGSVTSLATPYSSIGSSSGGRW